jgi:hypothetical protein
MPADERPRGDFREGLMNILDSGEQDVVDQPMSCGFATLASSRFLPRGRAGLPQISNEPSKRGLAILPAPGVL